MANELSTAGITIGYCVETTVGTKPTTGYTSIPNVKSIAELNPEPATLEVTDLSDTVWKRFIPGLKDLGGAIALTVNMTKAFITAWNTAISAYSTGIASGKATWWRVTVSGVGTFDCAGVPTAVGLPGIETDSVFEGDVYIVPNKIDAWTLEA